MFLAQDKKGRIYQTSRDRSDGMGFESAPEPVDQQDVTLDQTFIKADQEVSELNAGYDALAVAEKMNEESQEMFNESYKRRNLKLKAMMEQIQANPELQQNLYYEGLLQNQTRGADFNQLEISGYGMTADGIRTQPPRQRAYEQALMQQLGYAPAQAETSSVDNEIYDIDAVEREQILLSEEAERLRQGIASEQYYSSIDSYQAQDQAQPVALPPVDADLTGSGGITIKPASFTIPTFAWGILAYFAAKKLFA